MIDNNESFTIKLPSAVEVEGDLFPIKTNFLYWVQFAQMTSDKKTIVGDLNYLYEGITPKNLILGYYELKAFYNPPRTLPRPISSENIRVLDYALDFDLIAAAFYEVYKIDLYDETLKLHWHKFLLLLEGLHGTKLNEVMSYRAYKDNGDRKDKNNTQMLKLKKAWELPQVTELSKATQEFNDLLKK